MYLWGVKSASNLGGLGRLGRLGYRPNQAAQRIFRRRGRVLRGLGDDLVSSSGLLDIPTLDTSPVSLPSVDSGVPDLVSAGFGGSLFGGE